MSQHRSALACSFALAIVGCGGGNVDRGFYGEIAVEEKGATGPNAPIPSAKKKMASSRFERPKLILIRAAWCDICKAVEPSILRAYEPYKGKVDLVVLDVTDEASVAKSHARASDEGVRAFFTQYGARTPSVGVFVGAERGRLVHGNLSDETILARELDHAVGR